MKIRETYTCPLEFVHDMMRGKWKPIILFQLRSGPMSLAELEKSIEGITQKMLLQHLKELQNFDIVHKETFEGYPLKVAYYLSEDRGKRLLKAIKIMQDIGVDYMVEQGLTDVLDAKGIDYRRDTH